MLLTNGRVISETDHCEVQNQCSQGLVYLQSSLLFWISVERIVIFSMHVHNKLSYQTKEKTHFICHLQIYVTVLLSWETRRHSCENELSD